MAGSPTAPVAHGPRWRSEGLRQRRRVDDQLFCRCHSLQFPIIVSLAIEGLGDDTKLGSSLLVMSIVGGAIIPAAMGALSDGAGIQAALWIPVVCYAVVLYFATIGHRHTVSATA